MLDRLGEVAQLRSLASFPFAVQVGVGEAFSGAVSLSCQDSLYVVRCYTCDMTRSSQPTRLPADVYESAVAAARIASRTVPQQLAHWARIGRELEMSPQVAHREVARVLSGASSYDSLGEREQAIVREGWSDKISELRAGLNYESEFDAAGESYSEADDTGDVVIHPVRD